MNKIIFLASKEEKLKIELLYDLLITLLGIHLEKKTLTQKDTCTSMLILALFTITKTWKQPEIHLLTDEWIKKVWNVYVCVYIYIYIHIYIICSVTKCSTLCDPTDYSTPGFPVPHYLREFAQTHVHWVSDAIHSSCPLLPPFSSCPQSFTVSGSFPMSWLLA